MQVRMKKQLSGVKNPKFSHASLTSRIINFPTNGFFPFFLFLSCSGDYVCQISDKVTKDQVHTVEILGEFIKEMRTGK